MKPDPANLPHLVSLADDDSPLVRDSVLAKLAEFGDELDSRLRGLAQPPSEQKLVDLRGWLDEYRARVARFYTDFDQGTVVRCPLFQPGDRVRHRHYGYRGLVVDRDVSCQAGEDWYRQNRSQPDRQQPWYHVLVHDSDSVTYAAQTSLLPDGSGEEIRHALVPIFFEPSGSGYDRNDNPWPRSP